MISYNVTVPCVSQMKKTHGPKPVKQRKKVEKDKPSRFVQYPNFQEQRNNRGGMYSTKLFATSFVIRENVSSFV
jgi:hypothetical protein